MPDTSPENYKPLELRPDLYDPETGELDPEYAEKFARRYEQGGRTAGEIHTELGGLAVNGEVEVELKKTKTPRRRPYNHRERRRH